MTATESRTRHLVLSGMGISLILMTSLLAQPASAARPLRIGLFGDSLAVQAEPYFSLLTQAGGKAKVSNFTYGGTAACDWLPTMRKFARTEHPQAVVIEFAGNASTSCMFGHTPGSRDTLQSYGSEITQAIQAFLAVGAHVFLAGTPITRKQWMGHDRGWDDLNRAFAALAARYPKGVTYIDAGVSVEGPRHSFVSKLPCLYFEPCNGPTIAGVGTNVVRSPDGVHFCPTSTTNAKGRTHRCPVYSSGAFRFAVAMASPVIRELHMSSGRSATSAPVST